MTRLLYLCFLLLMAVSVSFLTGCDDGGTEPEEPPTYQISGTITESGSALPDVAVALTGETSSATTTDADGIYEFGGLANGDYTITPTMDDYVITPASLVQTVADADVADINFTATSVLLQDVVAYYPFDEDASDASGNGHNGTISGAALNNDGFIDECLSFNDGTTSNNVMTGVDLSTTAFTINLWAKQNDAARISLAGTMTHPSGGKTGFMFHSGGYGGAAPGCAGVVSWQSNATWMNFYGTTPVTTDEWNMYTYVYVAGGTSKIYQNGVLTASLPNSPSGPSNSTGLQIGRSFTIITGQNQVWSGLIDEVGIWARELTEEEVTAIYNSGSGLRPY